MSASSKTASPPGPPTTFPAGGAVAVVVARDGRLPVGAEEAVAEAAGQVLVVGSGAAAAAAGLVSAVDARWCDTGAGLRPASLAARLAPAVVSAALVILPASPDGRDLAPRLAAVLGRPLLAHAVEARVRAAVAGEAPAGVDATLARLDDRILLPVATDGPAVATLAPGARSPAPSTGLVRIEALALGEAPAGPPDPEVLAVLAPDPATMDLADATRVLGGGAGLATGLDEAGARACFDLLGRVAVALGAVSGATRVATDAGWTGYERQVGTTGVTIDPDLYVAFGVSGATQHVGGLGSPRHVVSVNTDPSAPMTAMADLGLVTDARALLIELARRLAVGVPEGAG